MTESLKVRRLSNRVYAPDESRKVMRPAEYAIFSGAEQVCSIVMGGSGWRVLVPGTKTDLGRAISPIGLDKFREVRNWFFEYFIENETEEIIRNAEI